MNLVIDINDYGGKCEPVPGAHADVDAPRCHRVDADGVDSFYLDSLCNFAYIPGKVDST